MGYVLGAVVGVACGVACIVAVGGAAGVAAGLVVAALLYVGIGTLLKPERRLGGVAASMLPNGEAAADRVAAARALQAELEKRRSQVRDAEVLRQVDELLHDIDALIACVEEQPGTYRRLAHFLSTYAEQCTRMLDGYLSVEKLGTRKMRADAREDALEALGALQGAAQGELARATGAKAAELEASSEAIKRLMEMDGYVPDARDAEPKEARAAAPSAEAEGSPAPFGGVGDTEEGR